MHECIKITLFSNNQGWDELIIKKRKDNNKMHARKVLQIVVSRLNVSLFTMVNGKSALHKSISFGFPSQKIWSVKSVKLQ